MKQTPGSGPYSLWLKPNCHTSNSGSANINNNDNNTNDNNTNNNNNNNNNNNDDDDDDETPSEIDNCFVPYTFQYIARKLP